MAVNSSFNAIEIVYSGNYLGRMRRILLAVLSLLCIAQAIAQDFNSNLPIIVINTNGQTIVNEPKIMADMGIVYNGVNVRNSTTDPFNHYSGKVGIEIRGQSSQMFPMKSYSIELWDALGNSVEKPLFGLPKESDWVLYAPYTDKTLMRNFLAYTMSREMGHWASNCRFVEVVVNHEYKGIYVLMEKIKRGSGRVNIVKINTTDISGDELTGGYIFSLDKEPNGWFSSYVAPGSTNGSKRQFSYVYPKPENIVAAQKTYLKNYVDGFENAMAAENFADPVNGARKFADLSSFIDFFIVNEISRNVDGYRLSTYFYKDRDSRNSKIMAGPVWDFDLAFRNANYCDGDKLTGWAYLFNKVCPGDGAGLIPFWWSKWMDKDVKFQEQLRCRWKELRKTVISEQRMNSLIDSIYTLTAEARQRHFQKWPILGTYVWPNPQPIPTSYDSEIQTLKTWLTARLNWIDENLPNTGSCSDYPREVKESVIISIYPNPLPANGSLSIRSRIAQTASITVFNANGQEVYNQQFQLTAGFNTITPPLEQWIPGVYFFRFTTSSGEKIIRKVIRQ